MNTIRRYLRALFIIQYDYATPNQHVRARGILVLTWLMIWGALAIILLAVDLSRLLSNIFQIVTLVQAGLLLASGAIILNLVQRGQLALASYILVGLSLVASLVSPLVLVVVVPIQLSLALLNRWEGLVVGVIVLSAVAYRIISEGVLPIPQVDNLFQLLLPILAVMLLLIVIQFLFARQSITETSATEDEGLLAPMQQVIAANSRITVDTTVAEAAGTTIRILREAFGYDFVQIYLLDENNQLSRRVRMGVSETTTEDADSGEVLSLGDANVISEAARIRQPIQVTANDVPSRRAHFLSAIQRGLLVPLLAGDETVGVVDIQSVTDRPFTEAEISLLAELGRQLGATIRQLRQTARIKQDLSEQIDLNNRLQAQMSQLQSQRQQLVADVWTEYIEQRGSAALGFDLAEKQLIRANDMPDAMADTLSRGETYVTVVGDEKRLHLPILLRGEMLGGMVFSMAADHKITERQLEMAEIITQRLGTALENTRLLQRTQSQANRERKATEAANQLITATDIDSLLRIAADTFNDTLGAIQTRIFLEPNPPTTASPGRSSPPANGNGHSGDLE